MVKKVTNKAKIKDFFFDKLDFRSNKQVFILEKRPLEAN